MENECKICGTKLDNDLFSFVTGEPVCSICKIKYLGGLSTTLQDIERARERLGLKPGEYLQQDRAAEASKILRR